MKSPLVTLVKAHRKTSIAVVVVTLYAALGFLLLPWVAQRQLVSLMQTRLGLETSVESVYFNPFSFYVEIEGLEVVDPAMGPLVSLSHSHLNFQPSRLLLLKLQVAELAIDGVTLDADRFSDGTTTASVLAARWLDSAEPQTGVTEVEPAAEASSLPAAEVLSLAVNGVEIRLRDAVPATAFSTVFLLKSFQLSDFSTLENTNGSYTLKAAFENDAPLNIDGTLSMVPLTTRGNLKLTLFPLPMLSRYAQDSLPLALSSGDFDLELDYRVDLAGATSVLSLSNLRTGIEGLVAVEDGLAAPFFSLASLS